MNIKEMRKQENLSQSQFAGKYGIPIRTLQEWEQERRRPPDYTVNMLARLMMYEKMISKLHRGGAEAAQDKEIEGEAAQGEAAQGAEGHISEEE